MSKMLNRIMPKVITPKAHVVLDILTVGAFLAMGGIWWRSKRGASIAALANGLFVAGFSALTDYEGDGSKPISFKNHGRLDAVQASMAEVAPKIFGFSEDKASVFFRGQAMNEAVVIALTDFEAHTRPRSRRRLNAA